MFYDQHIRGGFNNGAVNAPPWSIRVNVTEPAGPWSESVRGRDDFDRISLDAIGRRDAPFPTPVEANSYDEQFETPLTYNYNLTLEREVLTGWNGAWAVYVGSKVSTRRRYTISLNPAESMCPVRRPARPMRARPPTIRRNPHIRAGSVVELRRCHAADAQSAVLTRLYSSIRTTRWPTLSATSATS